MLMQMCHHQIQWKTACQCSFTPMPLQVFDNSERKHLQMCGLHQVVACSLIFIFILWFAFNYVVNAIQRAKNRRGLGMRHTKQNSIFYSDWKQTYLEHFLQLCVELKKLPLLLCQLYIYAPVWMWFSIDTTFNGTPRWWLKCRMRITCSVDCFLSMQFPWSYIILQVKD